MTGAGIHSILVQQIPLQRLEFPSQAARLLLMNFLSYSLGNVNAQSHCNWISAAVQRLSSKTTALQHSLVCQKIFWRLKNESNICAEGGCGAEEHLQIPAPVIMCHYSPPILWVWRQEHLVLDTSSPTLTAEPKAWFLCCFWTRAASSSSPFLPGEVYILQADVPKLQMFTLFWTGPSSAL